MKKLVIKKDLVKKLSGKDLKKVVGGGGNYSTAGRKGTCTS